MWATWCTPPTPTRLLVITQLQPIAVVFTLPEDNLQTVSQHMHQNTLPVEAYSRDDLTKLATGKLLTIDNQIDQTTGTGRLKAMFDNPDDALWPNQFVNVRLLLETHKGSIVIPSVAVQTGPQGSYVFTVKPDKTVAVSPVTVSFTQNNVASIASGVAPGDIVVVDGQDKLQAGSKVDPHAMRAEAARTDNCRPPRPRPRSLPHGSAMNPSRLFILRPVATTLLMVGLLLVGVVAYTQLPVSALPEVDYPTIQVVTFYPGADPDVMASSVTAPLERQFGQVPGLSQMTSTSSLGSSIITLQFNLNENIDVEEQQVQAAINAATTYLPARSAESADLQQGEPGRFSDHHAGPDFGHVAAFESRRPGGHRAGPENFAASRRRPGFDQRRTEAGGADPGQSHGAGFLRTESGRHSDRAGSRQRQPGQGRAGRPATVLHHRRQ